MFCTNCGNSLSDDIKFCPYCGNRLGAENTSVNPGGNNIQQSHTMAPHFKSGEEYKVKYKHLVTPKDEWEDATGELCIVNSNGEIVAEYGLCLANKGSSQIVSVNNAVYVKYIPVDSHDSEQRYTCLVAYKTTISGKAELINSVKYHGIARLDNVAKYGKGEEPEDKPDEYFIFRNQLFLCLNFCGYHNDYSENDNTCILLDKELKEINKIKGGVPYLDDVPLYILGDKMYSINVTSDSLGVKNASLVDMNDNTTVIKLPKEQFCFEQTISSTELNSSRNLYGSFSYTIGSIKAFGASYFMIGSKETGFGLVNKQGDTIIPISSDNLFITDDSTKMFDDKAPAPYSEDEFDDKDKWFPPNTFMVMCKNYRRKIVDRDGRVLAEGIVDADSHTHKYINEIRDSFL